MSVFQKVVLIITIIGALNWGLIGIFDFNLVSFIFAEGSFLSRAIYTIVGICGVINLALLTLENRKHL